LQLVIEIGGEHPLVALGDKVRPEYFVGKKQQDENSCRNEGSTYESQDH
jgi:hypothetical protein